MKQLAIILFAAVTFSACNNPVEDKTTQLLTKKWKATYSSEIDSNEHLISFLDTVGNNTTPDQNEQIYGIRDMDSFKKVNLSIIQDRLAMQRHSLDNTWMEFYNDGKVVRNFSGLIDTTIWSVDTSGKLTFGDPAKGGEIYNMDIIQLKDSVLELNMVQQNGGVINMVFTPQEK